MKINIWNRDRSGGHQASLVFDRGEIAGSTSASRKAVKQFTGRKLRREANKAAREADTNYQEDLDCCDIYSYWDNLSDHNMAYMDEPK